MDSVDMQVARSAEAFPDRLSEAMARSGKSVKQVASETGIAYGTVASYVRGERNPLMASIVALCACLGTSADYLLGLDARWR